MNVREGERWDGNSKAKWSAVPASLSQVQKAEVAQEKTEEEKLEFFLESFFFFFNLRIKTVCCCCCYCFEVYILKYLRTMKSLSQALRTTKAKKKR